MLYTLSLSEWEDIEIKAEARNNIKMPNTSVRVDNKKTDLQIHIYGMAAEYAFGKLFGLQPDLGAQLKGDAGYDFVFPGGLTAEIRYRFERNRDFSLYSDRLEDFKADFGVLVWPGPSVRQFEIIGWVSKVGFAMMAKRKYLKGWRLLVPWQWLRKPEELHLLNKNSNSSYNPQNSIISINS